MTESAPAATTGISIRVLPSHMEEDGAHMWMIAVDGRRSDAPGMTCDDVQSLMLELGCWDGAMLDGGSTTLVVDGEVVNRPRTEVGEMLEPPRVRVTMFGRRVRVLMDDSARARPCGPPGRRRHYVRRLRGLWRDL